MAIEETAAERIAIEARGASLLVRIHGGEYQWFGAELVRQLEALVNRIENDPGVGAVVFTSAHSTRFVSHADVGWLQRGALEYAARQRGDAASPPPADYVGLERLHALFLRMNSIGVVFVAALEGAALGLGAELAWACDLRVMADAGAFIGQPEVLLGIMPGGGGSQRLTRLVGAHRALVAIMDGRPFTPSQALAIGAVDAVVPKAQVVPHALSLGDHLATRHKASLAAIKRAVYFGGSLPLPEGIKLESREFLGLDIAATGQERMVAYQRETEARGELPLFAPGGYDAALAAGRSPHGHDSV